MKKQKATNSSQEMKYRFALESFIFIFCVCLDQVHEYERISNFDLLVVNYRNSHFLMFKTIKYVTIQKTLLCTYRHSESEGTFIYNHHLCQEKCAHHGPHLNPNFLTLPKVTSSFCGNGFLFSIVLSFKCCFPQHCGLDLPDFARYVLKPFKI